MCFYLIEQHSKFLLHTLQVLYICTLFIPALKVRNRTAIETISADMLQKVWNELDYRVDVCRITKGAHSSTSNKKYGYKLQNLKMTSLIKE